MKKRAKRFLAIVTMLAMIISSMPVAAFAGDSNTQTVAQIGDTQYTSLQTAIDDAEPGETVTLIRDIELEANLSVSKEITLDLNGKKMETNVVSDYATVYVGPAGDLTITDSVGDGEIINKSGDVVVGNYGKVTVESGTLTSENGADDGVWDAALYNFYYNGTTYGTASITGGTLNGYVWNSGVMDITGGILNKGFDNSGKMTVSGTVEVNGEIYAGDGADTPDLEGKGTLVITGGTFNTDVTAYLDAAVYKQKETGEVVRYAATVATAEELQEAIEAGMTDITLTKALVYEEEVTLEAEVPTTITVEDTTATADAFTAEAGGNLTLGNNLTIKSDAGGVLWAINGGIINVDGAVIDCKVMKYSAAAAQRGGVINVLSGTVKGTDNDKVTLVARHDGSVINIKGGEVISTHSTALAVLDGSDATITGGTVETTIVEPTLCAVHVQGDGSTLDVTGGTVTAATGGAIVPETKANVSISDGIISGGQEKGAVYTHHKENPNDGSVLTITGGTFNTDVTEYLDTTKYEQKANGEVIAHRWQPVAGVTRTCTTEGQKAHYKCETCGLLCEDKDNVVFVELDDLKLAVDPNAHSNVEPLKAVASTCTKAGKTEGAWCSACGTITIAQKNVDKKKHSHGTAKVEKKATTKGEGKLVTRCKVCNTQVASSKIYKIKSVSLSKTTYTYTGKYLKPSVTVKNTKNQKISSKYYTVSYKNHKYTGKASVIVKFKDRYSGTITKTFKINPKKPTILKPAAAKKAVTVKWKKVSGKISGYEVMYSTSKSFKKGSATKTKLVKSTKTSYKATKLKAKKTYYVKVRAYKTVGKTKYYSAWSLKKSVRTK